MRDFDPTASEFITSGYLETSRPGGRLHDPITAMVVGTVGSSLIGADAAGDAADAQAGAARDTNATNKAIFDKQVELQAPFRETGLTANNRLAQMMGLVGGGDANGSLMQSFDASKMYKDPGYAFRMGEGMKGVENSAAARGGLLSGAALKAIQKYGQDYASNEYGNAYGRFNADQTNKYNRLAGLVNTGMGATNQINDAAGQFATRTASVNSDLGDARSAGIMGSANAWANGIGQGSNALMQMIQNPGFTSSQIASANSTNVPYGYQPLGF